MASVAVLMAKEMPTGIRRAEEISLNVLTTANVNALSHVAAASSMTSMLAGDGPILNAFPLAKRPGIDTGSSTVNTEVGLPEEEKRNGSLEANGSK